MQKSALPLLLDAKKKLLLLALAATCLNRWGRRSPPVAPEPWRSLAGPISFAPVDARWRDDFVRAELGKEGRLCGMTSVW